MPRICKNCQKKLGIFEAPEVNEQGDIICKACSDKMKAEQEQAQKQKEDEDYRVNLAKALAKNSQWEYKILNAGLGPENEEQLNKLGAEGWQLVSVLSAGSNNSAPQPAPAQQNPEQTQQPPPQPQEPTKPAPASTVYIFKRKL